MDIRNFFGGGNKSAAKGTTTTSITKSKTEEIKIISSPNKETIKVEVKDPIVNAKNKPRGLVIQDDDEELDNNNNNNNITSATVREVEPVPTSGGFNKYI